MKKHGCFFAIGIGLTLMGMPLVPSFVSAEPSPEANRPLAEQRNWGWWWEILKQTPAPGKNTVKRTDAEISWIVLEDMLKQAEQQANPQERIYILDASLQRLDKYRAATPPSLRAFGIEDVSQKLTKDYEATLAELRSLKEKEQQVAAPSSSPIPSLIDLWKRITSENAAIPFTPREIAQIAQVGLFSSGPHVSKFDLRYVESFGHYNPAFLEWAKKTLVPRDAKYFQATDPIFQAYLCSHAEQLLGARYYLISNRKKFEMLSRRYKSALEAKRVFTPTDEIPYTEDSFDGPYLAYWLRRDIDGTASAVQELLELVLDAYRPDIVLELKHRYRKSSYALTVNGSYHSDEVVFEKGEKVFSLLFGEYSNSVLHTDVIEIERFYDPIMNEPGEKSGKTVSLRSKSAENVLILRGNFTPGPVTAVHIPPLNECVGNGCHIEFLKRRYTIKVAQIDEKMGESLSDTSNPSYLIELSDGTTTKVIRSIREIVWAGDLDRDGRLDLVYDDVFHYNVMTSLHLLLSSPSSFTPLTEVAHCVSVGC